MTDSVEATERRAAAPSVFSGQSAAERPAGAPVFGRLPLLVATASIGLLLVAVADARSRSMASESQTLFWLGLIVVYAPIVGRLAHAAPRRLERMSLTVFLGLALYLVKVFRDPFGFTFADELVHAPNADAILRTHHLFHANAILQAPPYYPGLESVTAALASLSGLTVFGAGLIVIGVARLLIVLALFLLVERLLGSARAGGLAVAVYAANSNFVFFSAQFSYESLALPLLVVALFAYGEWRGAQNRPARILYAVAIVLLTFAVVTTHHLTSYALAVTFIVIAIAYRLAGSRHDAPGGFAAFAVVAVGAWLVAVASTTVGYLTPVFTSAFHSVAQTISGESAPRQLFGGKAGSESSGSGLIGRAAAVGGVAVLRVLYLFGARDLWRRYRHDPFAVVLAIAGLLVFATYVARFAPQAWETANRSTEFLFLGLSVVVPLGIVHLGARLAGTRFAVAAAAVLTLAFAGGVVSGWTPSLRLSQPYEISAGGNVVPAQGRAMASWALHVLGPGRRYAASDADARLLNTYADSIAITGRHPDVADLLKSPTLESWELPLLRDHDVRYVVTDRRRRSFDNTAGYFFGFRSGPQRDERLPKSAVRKFRRFDRIFDSGDIVIYKLGQR
jgi:hypothetical protein